MDKESGETTLILIIGGCIYNNHLKRQDDIELEKAKSKQVHEIEIGK